MCQRLDGGNELYDLLKGDFLGIVAKTGAPVFNIRHIVATARSEVKEEWELRRRTDQAGKSYLSASQVTENIL